MDATPRTIDYYETRDGKRPFLLWLEDQDLNVQARVVARFKNVEKGNFGDHHGEGEGVFALIYDFGPGYRVYYALTDRQKVVLLLTGGGKKKQSRDIRQALEYWRDYKNRRDEEEESRNS